MQPDFSPDPVTARLLVALAIIAAGLLAYRLANYLSLNRARSRRLLFDPAAQGKPVLLYFTTPTCAPCKTIQRPAIRRVQELVGERLEVVEIDASLQPEIASQWGVLSVPTTFVIDGAGTPRFVNHGIASAEKLLDQFQTMLSG